MQTQNLNESLNIATEVPRIVPLDLVVEDPKNEQSLAEEEFESGDHVEEVSMANAAATMTNMARAILAEYGLQSNVAASEIASSVFATSSSGFTEDGHLYVCLCAGDAEECHCGCEEDSTYDADEEVARGICLCSDDAEECDCGCESDVESEYRDTWEDKALDFDTYHFDFPVTPNQDQDTVIPETPRRRPVPASTNAPVAARLPPTHSVLGRRSRLSIQIPDVDELAPCIKRLSFRDDAAEVVLRYYADREVDENDDAASIASSTH